MANVADKRSWSEVQHLPSYSPVLPQVANLIKKVAEAGDASDHVVTSFSIVKGTSANISISDYLIRLCKHARCSPQIFPMALIIMDRFLGAVPWSLSSLNVHRVIATAFILTVKTHDDVFFSNSFYSTVFGLPLGELNSMERQMLNALQWDLHVDTAWYDRLVASLGEYVCQTPMKTQPIAPVAVAEKKATRSVTQGKTPQGIRVTRTPKIGPSPRLQASRA